MCIYGLAAGSVWAQSTEKAVFIVNNVSDEITSYVFHDDGTVDFVGNYPADDGPMAIDISPSGKYLAVTHGTQNEDNEVITFFEVMPDASLNLLGTDLVPNAPLGVAWVSENVLAVTRTNFGGLNEVITYQFDPELASITQVDAENTGGFCTSVIRHPSGQYLFANDSGGPYHLYMFQVDAAGNLTLLDTETTSIYPLNPTLSPDGGRVYAGGGISGSGHDILGLQAAPGSGFIPLPGSPYTSPGSSPAYPAVSTDGQVLFCGHGSDGRVYSFLINGDGSLTSTGHFHDFGIQGSIGDVECLDDYLLVTDETTAVDGVAGLFVFAIHPDGSFTQVGDVHDTGGVRPEAMVTWTPPMSCPGDLDGDGDTDQSDLGILLGAYENNADGDLDGDGDTDQSDLGLLLSDYGCGG